MNLLLIIVRTIFFYFLIFLVYRMMGKREVGQLGIIDLIVSILIAELAVISIENYDNNMMSSVLPILTLLVLQMILAFLTLKMPKFRIFLDGNPSVIIKDGRVNYKEMTKQKYNLDDLMIQIREKGYRSIEEIEYAILETSGQVSIIEKPNRRNTIPEDFGINPEYEGLPYDLVLDGKIMNENLIKVFLRIIL